MWAWVHIIPCTLPFFFFDRYTLHTPVHVMWYIVTKIVYVTTPKNLNSNSFMSPHPLPLLSSLRAVKERKRVEILKGGETMGGGESEEWGEGSKRVNYRGLMDMWLIVDPREWIIVNIASNNSLITKIKNLNGHVSENCTPIEI